jgi:hypothetical protein
LEGLKLVRQILDTELVFWPLHQKRRKGAGISRRQESWTGENVLTKVNVMTAADKVGGLETA